MDNKLLTDVSMYDHAFQVAYGILMTHIQSGTAVTADLPECLAGLTRVIREYGERQDSLPEQEPRT